MNNNLKIALLIKTIILFFLPHILYSQWTLNFGTAQNYNSNPFNNPQAEESVISSFELGIENQFDSIGIGYYGDYSLFHQIKDRDYYWHQFGLWNFNNNLIYGLYLEQRFNTSTYDYYNYSNYDAYLKYRFILSDINVFTNASISLTNYSYLDDLDNVLGTIGIILNKSFETKTTFIGGVKFNIKNYFSTDLNESELVGDSLHSSVSSAYTSQINYFLRISQSIVETTGIAFQFSHQNIIAGTANYIRQLDYIYGDESQYFDDPISYDGKFISAQLTQIIPGDIFLRAKYDYGTKSYPSQGIYLTPDQFVNSKIRNDHQSIFNISISKHFYLGDEFDNTLKLSLSFESVVNNSNSYWYDYKSSGIKIYFNYQF